MFCLRNLLPVFQILGHNWGYRFVCNTLTELFEPFLRLTDIQRASRYWGGGHGGNDTAMCHIT